MVRDKPEREVGSLNLWPLALVCLFFLAGLGLVLARHWRRGSVVMGAALGLGALLRLVLPEEVAGLLVVRSRLFDCALLAGVGVGMMVLGMVVPGTYT